MAILLRYTPDFMRRHRWSLQVQSVLSKIFLCRTAHLGGRIYECPQCHLRTNLYNSCADRHCPQCAGARRADWLDKAAKLLLPRVNYFQIVFTLPDYLHGLTLGNRSQIFKLLFQAAWRSLNTELRRTGQFQPAALMVLHTWNQQLDFHPHLHAIVPGGGPSLEGDQWITSGHPTQRRRRNPYLVDNVALGRRFREEFIDGLRQLLQRGELKLEGVWSDLLDPQGREDWLDELKAIDWNVFIEGPPCGQSDPKQVLKYLARYLTGGPIADSRLIRIADDRVTFWARPKTNQVSQPKRLRKAQEPFALRCVEFVRRWCLHILPKGFTRTRRYGGFSGSQADEYLQRCRSLLNTPTEENPPATASPPDAATDSDAHKCLRCQGELLLIENTPRPSWRDVFERIYPDHTLYNPTWHMPHVPHKFSQHKYMRPPPDP